MYAYVPPCHPLSLPDSRLQSLSRTTSFAARFFSSFERKCCLLGTCLRHMRKKTGRGAY
jgi:hypothetical protein